MTCLSRSGRPEGCLFSCGRSESARHTGRGCISAANGRCSLARSKPPTFVLAAIRLDFTTCDEGPLASFRHHCSLLVSFLDVSVILRHTLHRLRVDFEHWLTSSATTTLAIPADCLQCQKLACPHSRQFPSSPMNLNGFDAEKMGTKQ